MQINNSMPANMNFGKFGFRSLESSKNIKLTGNIIKDTFIKYPRTIALGSTLAALLTAGGVMTSSLNSIIKAHRAEERAEIIEMFNEYSPNDLSGAIYQKAKSNLSYWKIKTAIVDQDGEPCKMVVMQFSPEFDKFNGTFISTAQATPPYIKNAFGLNDRVLNKYNDLKAVLTDENRSGHSNYDNDLFRPGIQIMFPFSEIGKNAERAREFYLNRIK